MKGFILLCTLFVLVSCDSKNPWIKAHLKAKAKGKTCYRILLPKEISGHYCLVDMVEVNNEVSN